ncbi:MAG: histidine kinase [Pseudoclavibacter sp.]|nr:histidine kinase [Pseudoclavibacter sp.]
MPPRSVPPRRTDLVLASLLTVLCLWLGTTDRPEWFWSAAMTPSLALRRSLPWGFAGVCLTVSAVHLLLEGSLLFPGDLLSLLAVCTVTVHSSERLRHLGLLAAVSLSALAASTALFPLGTAGGGDPLSGLMPAALLLSGSVTAWALGMVERGRRATLSDARRLRELTERDARTRARLAAHEERERIRDDLHDILAHTLSGLIVQAESGRATAAACSERELFTRIAGSARGALAELRGLLAAEYDDELTGPVPGVPEAIGLAEAAKRSGLRVHSTILGEPVPLAPGMGLAVYRVVQESLSNALRHGDGRSASLRLEWGREELAVTFENPLGEEQGPPASTGGRGLAGIRRRAALYGARVEIETSPVFRITSRWPLPAPAERVLR